MFIMYKFDQNPFIDARYIHDEPEKFTENRSRIRAQSLCNYELHFTYFI